MTFSNTSAGRPSKPQSALDIIPLHPTKFAEREAELEKSAQVPHSRAFASQPGQGAPSPLRRAAGTPRLRWE